MSFLVTARAVDALGVAAAARRQVLRRRVRRVIVSMGLLGGLAAVPLPARSTSASLRDQTIELQASIEAAEGELGTLSSWDGNRGLAAKRGAALWLGHADVLDLRNELLATASACGLEVRSLDTTEDLDPLAEDADSGVSTLVLGSADDEWDEEHGSGEMSDESAAEVESELPDEPVLAVRFAIKGEGPMSSFFVFTGLLPHLNHPMRLRSAKLTRVEKSVSFIVQVDKLLAPLSALEPESQQ